MTVLDHENKGHCGRQLAVKVRTSYHPDSFHKCPARAIADNLEIASSISPGRPLPDRSTDSSLGSPWDRRPPRGGPPHFVATKIKSILISNLQRLLQWFSVPLIDCSPSGSGL